MSDELTSFGGTAKGLSKNPLGIIALFITLVYGFASLVAAFSGSFTAAERLPLIYFLIVFPVLVLAVFAWLVSRHAGKLYSPSDFKDEDNYLAAVASLAVATVRRPDSDSSLTNVNVRQIAEVVRKAAPSKRDETETWSAQILWVDDRPDNNIYVRKAFEAVGLNFTLAFSTQEALNIIRKKHFAAIISDMGRGEGPREGFVLLEALRQQGNTTPFFIFTISDSPEQKRETIERGGQYTTNDPQELFQMVTAALLKKRSG